MNDHEVERRLRSVVGEACGRDVTELDLDADLVRELGLDSLANLRVLAAVEKGCGVRFPDDRLSELRTLRQMLELMTRGPES